MPSTRSSGQAQPTLAFPRRKSSRVSSQGKTPQREESPAASPSKPETQNLNLGRIGTDVPPRRPAVARTSTLSSPLSLRAPPSPPSADTAPLSPRKRTGDDNGCNLDGSSLRRLPPEAEQAGRGILPESSASTRTLRSSVRRRLVPSLSPRKPQSPNTGSSPRRQDTPAGTPEGKQAVSRLFAEKSRFLSVKKALHTALPERLLSREVERDAIRCFLRDKALQRVPGSLYISGAPGTGKTACFNCVLKEMEPELSSVQTVLVNCMSLRSSHAIFRLLAEKLKAPGGQSGLQRFLTAPGPAVLLVLDEMDQLDSKSQDVLYTIFEWPYLSQSRLCLVGIANALDLTDRILPRLQARPQCRPLLLTFPPLQPAGAQRHRAGPDSLRRRRTGSWTPRPFSFCARKVSAVSGDARKALDICRRAVEVVESDERKKSSDQKDEAKVSRVSLPQVARVLSEVYGDRMAGKSKEVVLGKLHEVYSRLCSQRQVSAVGQSECLSLCGLLESRGVFALKKAKEARLTKPVEAVEGGSATLQCRLDPPINLSSRTVEWNRGHTLYVHVYRSRRDDPDSQMLQYRDRTTLNHGDLTRGVSTLTISNVSLSDTGSYEVYLPQLEVRCSTHLTVALPLACIPSQPVEAVEGGSATLQCRLDHPINLSSRTVEWNRGHTLYVHVYRSQRDDPDSQMLQYRDRTTLNHGDLTRGVSTLTISNVSLSDNGSYEVYLPQLEVRCSTHLTVGKSLIRNSLEALRGKTITSISASFDNNPQTPQKLKAQNSP
ncbi:hypothetical protein JOQ06_022074 [Pogonophryne albipinna]|uniref:Ig-like domain-containing protein n=1 Tax=Pogonophryne albipinna TaxID=1090488 RepID=A0AAD6A851_9TELE|nr:hypothetical protein JOQ06_022074 [Pogonophryne albipinna]